MTYSASATIRLMVVSRDPSLLRPLWSIGESNAWHVETAGSGWEAMERVESGAAPDVLLLDLPRGDEDSLHVLRWLRRLRPALPIILLSHAEDLVHEKQAAKLGAQGFLTRPFDERQLELAIRRHMIPLQENNRPNLSSENVEHLGGDLFFVGISPAMQMLRAQAELLAQASVPVLIVGEPGSGKDTIAQLIHKLSIRSQFKFLKVNCGVLPEDLLESELFGCRAESTEDGERLSPGKLELCDKGTIFLDEIVQVPVGLQEKLLHVIKTKRLKFGGCKPQDVDVRILAAIDGNLEGAMSERALLEDLYYRLSAFTIHVPPLRQRTEDIPILLQHFMHKLATRYSLPLHRLSPAVLEASQRYRWPGNVRELENFVKRYLVIGDIDLTMGWGDEGDATESGKASHVGDVSACSKREAGTTSTARKSLKSLVTDVKCEAERNAIAAALEKTGWNRKAAARLLNVSYRTILYKIERYEMHSPNACSSSNIVRIDANGWKGHGKRL